MTNAEKFKTPQERIKAFHAFCVNHSADCKHCPAGYPELISVGCVFCWLELEANEEESDKKN